MRCFYRRQSLEPDLAVKDDRARRALRPWAVLIVRYLSRRRGAKQATIREIDRVVFEGSANPSYRALVQSLLQNPESARACSGASSDGVLLEIR